jgi:hypothetical protein
MKFFKYIALLSFFLSYSLLVLLLVFDPKLKGYLFDNEFAIIWAGGFISVLVNLTYSFFLKKKYLVKIILFLSGGIVWAFPPLLLTVAGTPFHLVYFSMLLIIYKSNDVAFLDEHLDDVLDDFKS